MTDLHAESVDMVQIDVSVTKRVDEVARLQTRDVRDHVGEQRVTGNVEWHPESL